MHTRKSPHNKQKGIILLTTLVMLVFMAGVIMLTLDALLTLEKNFASRAAYLRQEEQLRKMAIELIQQKNWPERCFSAASHLGSGCVYRQSHYSLKQIKTNACSTILTKNGWRDARIYHLNVWQYAANAAMFIRFVKPDRVLNCKDPKHQYRQIIVAEASQYFS